MLLTALKHFEDIDYWLVANPFPAYNVNKRLTGL